MNWTEQLGLPKYHKDAFTQRTWNDVSIKFESNKISRYGMPHKS